MNRSASAALGAAALLVLLAGCATPAGTGPSATPDLVDPTTGTEIEVDAAWLDGGDVIGLVTIGSSTCVPTADEATYSEGALEVTFVEPSADTICTRDMVPRVTLVAVPDGVDPTQDLDIWVVGDAYQGEAELSGVAGLTVSGETDYLPSAGWTEADGQFLILTWGSSTCVPVLEDATATGPAEVTVTFQTPPDDEVCTMDMVDRATVVFVDGPDDDSDVFAILAGAEFDNIRIPIVGSN